MPNNTAEEPTTEQTALPKRRRLGAWPLLVGALLIGMGLGGSAVVWFLAKNTPVSTQSMIDTYGEINHTRWMSGQYRAEAETPSEEVLVAAYGGDDEAIHKLSDSNRASALVNTYISICSDLVAGYNATAATAEGKQAIAGTKLPTHIDSAKYCHETDAKTPFTPGIVSYYLEKNGK